MATSRQATRSCKAPEQVDVDDDPALDVIRPPIGRQKGYLVQKGHPRGPSYRRSCRPWISKSPSCRETIWVMPILVIRTWATAMLSHGLRAPSYTGAMTTSLAFIVHLYAKIGHLLGMASSMQNVVHAISSIPPLPYAVSPRPSYLHLHPRIEACPCLYLR